MDREFDRAQWDGWSLLQDVWELSWEQEASGDFITLAVDAG